MTLGRTAMIEALGWAATAVFVGSYFCSCARTLVRVQMLGALMWTAYGLLMGAPPVVAANLLVLGAAAWKSRRPADSGPGPAGRKLLAHGGPPPPESGLLS